MKRRKVSVEDDSDDEFGLDEATQKAMLEDGMPQVLYLIFWGSLISLNGS
jgi:hypothetical protein